MVLPPNILSTPLTQAAIGQNYSYTAIAADPENDQLRFELGKHPLGMSIDSTTGEITWIPGAVGTETVELLVTDSQGGIKRQTWGIQVGLAEKVKKTGAKYFVVEQPRVIITFSLANLLSSYLFLITQVRKVFFLEKRPKKPLPRLAMPLRKGQLWIIHRRLLTLGFPFCLD